MKNNFKNFQAHFSRSSLSRSFALWVALLLFVMGAMPALAQSQPAPGGSSVSLSGTFIITRGDPGPGTAAQAVTLYSLADDQGVTHQLNINPGTIKAPDGVVNLYGKRVKLSGTTSQSVGGSPKIEVQSLQLETTVRAPQPATPGANPFISILCHFSDSPNPTPKTVSYFQTQLSNTRPGFDNYFREQSYDQYNLAGSAVAGWYNMPQPRTFYINGVKTSDQYLDELARDCTGAANQGGVNFASPTQYYGINLMFDHQLDNAAWGGGQSLTLNGVTKFWRMTWMPYWGAGIRFGWNEHGVLAHELSHAFGSPHSGSSVGFEYGSSWDVVSNPQANCTAAVIDSNYGCIGQHVIAQNKDAMGFIPASRKYTYSGSAPQTISLDRLAQPNSASSYLMVKIPVSASVFYTVESRFRVGYDLKLPKDGVIIHKIDLTRDPPAWIVAPPGVANDATRCPDTGPCGVGDGNAVWPVGSTFTDAANNINIKIDSFNATNGIASLTINPQPLQPTAALAFYALPQPIRVLDTRPGAQALYSPANGYNIIQAGTALNVKLANITYNTVKIPTAALLVAANTTVVNPAGAGFLTSYPGPADPTGAAKPLAASMVFKPNDLVSNGTNLTLGTDGTLNVYAHAATNVVMDVTGYYAPIGTTDPNTNTDSGLRFYPLAQPLRFVDTRPGSQAFYTPANGNATIQGGTASNYVMANKTYSGATIPAAAKALAANTTAVGSVGAGFLTSYPGPADPTGAAKPLAASMVYGGNALISNSSPLLLGADGSLNVYSFVTTDIVVDIVGYYAPANTADPNGVSTGLSFYGLAKPVRFVDTRSGAQALYSPANGKATLQSNTAANYQMSNVSYSGINIPVSAKVLDGNTTVVNSQGAGFLTSYPGPANVTGSAKPLAASIVFNANDLISNGSSLPLGADGTLNIYAFSTTDIVVDITGYYS